MVFIAQKAIELSIRSQGKPCFALLCVVPWNKYVGENAWRRITQTLRSTC